MKRTINYFCMGAVAIALLTFAACSKKNDALPAIDGYNSSDDVGSANLVAHWTFDGTNNEAISGSGPTKTVGTVGFTTGVLGQAANFQSGILLYPALAKLADANTLNNYTVSMWVNVAGTKRGTNAFSVFLSLAPTSVSDIWPDVFLGAETSRHLPASDTLELKSLMNTHPASGKDQEDNIAQPNPNAAPAVDAGTGAWFLKTAPTAWVHMVVSWDASTHQFALYGDAKLVGGYSTRANTGVEILAVPVLPIFGSFPSTSLGFTSAPGDQGFAPPLIAMIDDVRVFSTVLAQKDVSALHDLGLAGR